MSRPSSTRVASGRLAAITSESALQKRANASMLEEDAPPAVAGLPLGHVLAQPRADDGEVRDVEVPVAVAGLVKLHGARNEVLDQALTAWIAVGKELLVPTDSHWETQFECVPLLEDEH